MKNVKLLLSIIYLDCNKTIGVCCLYILDILNEDVIDDKELTELVVACKH
jgi:hypothetical protein